MKTFSFLIFGYNEKNSDIKEMPMIFCLWCYLKQKNVLCLCNVRKIFLKRNYTAEKNKLRRS